MFTFIGVVSRVNEMYYRPIIHTWSVWDGFFLVYGPGNLLSGPSPVVAVAARYKTTPCEEFPLLDSGDDLNR